MELTRYQLLGSSLDASGHRPGRVCVSTIAEAEALIPLIKEGLVTDVGNVTAQRCAKLTAA